MNCLENLTGYPYSLYKDRNVLSMAIVSKELQLLLFTLIFYCIDVWKHIYNSKKHYNREKSNKTIINKADLREHTNRLLY